MRIRSARQSDCHAIAELALMAGEGIPAYFWQEARGPAQSLIDVGAARAASNTANFSYLNVQVAEREDAIAGMLLGYPLPETNANEDLDELPRFIRPLVELEQQIPGSFYINMLATYPRFRGCGVGTALLAKADELAHRSGCRLIGIQVFEQNRNALRLYEKLGFSIFDSRAVVPHDCHPYTGRVILLTREVF